MVSIFISTPWISIKFHEQFYLIVFYDVIKISRSVGPADWRKHQLKTRKTRLPECPYCLHLVFEAFELLSIIKITANLKLKFREIERDLRSQNFCVSSIQPQLSYDQEIFWTSVRKLCKILRSKMCFLLVFKEFVLYYSPYRYMTLSDTSTQRRCLQWSLFSFLR